MKKSNLILLLLIALLVVTGCDNSKSTIVTSSGDKVDVKEMEHKHCTRSSSQSDGISTELSYELYYTGDVLNILESNEKVISDDSSKLDEYQKAYESINKYYVGLKYYDTEIKREDNSVVRHTTINYDKIDIDKLLDIIEDKKAKVQLWLDLAKKFGTKCEKVTE